MHTPGMGVRHLALGLLASVIALAGAWDALDSLTNSFCPRDPTEAEFADLADGYALVDFGTQECGQGGSYQCGQTLVIAHDRTDGELQAEVQRVTDANLRLRLGQLAIDDLAPGQSQVHLAWGARDPGPWEFLGMLALMGAILISAVMAAVLLMAMVFRGLTTRRV